MRKSTIVLALLIAVSLPAWGDPASASLAAAGSPADQMSRLQTQLTLLKLEAKIAKLKTEIAGGGSASPLPGAALPPPVPGGQSGMAVTQVSAPRVKLWSISQRDGHFVATLSIGGHPVDVRQGDPVNGGWRVETITTRTVVIKRNGAVKVLRI
ncbi:MAG: type IV pilus biogenesis protein PilP [Betaproteobacteria bacterium]|nr:type IV pilus biogenesis protein PilP [Betaproteobacteria bacterium]